MPETLGAVIQTPRSAAEHICYIDPGCPVVSFDHTQHFKVLFVNHM